MKSYDIILFDLDGTLTDPGVGITNSVAYALEKYHIQVEDRKQLYRFIGPPLHESFENDYGFSEEEAKTAVEYYREYFKEKGMFENVVYEGISELLRNLKDRGKTLVVATSKPEIFAKQILEHFGLKEYFTYIAGANMDGTRTKKDEVIRYALQSCGISQVAGVVMVGDREHDIMGANKVGLDSIGVLFGYGSRKELTDAGATYIAESVDMLSEILL
ncbi:MAG: HAD family hydrolase [Lachnospiraceae bacterium]|nr:HAD family hydrolase [Lachnospiraceae bacterium]